MSSTLSLLGPGQIPYNPGPTPSVGGLPTSFSGLMASNLGNLLPAGLAAANVGAVASGQVVTSGQVTSGAPFVLTSNFTVFTSGAVSGCVQLNPAISGLCEILNRTAVTLTAYPLLVGGSGQIEALGNNTGVAIASGANGKFLYAGVNGASGNLWYEW